MSIPAPWRLRWHAKRRAARATRLPNTIVLWAGPSALDGTLILLVASRVNAPSENSKTGDMLQVWICRADMDPATAWAAGLDGSVCPDACVHRSKGRGGRGTCYVNKARLSAAHRAAVREYLAGRIGWIPGSFAGCRMRAGMEGDPSAVPLDVWRSLLSEAAGHTGYTAAWRTLPREWSALFMASVSSPADYIRARSLGWRPFAASDRASDDSAYVAAGATLCEATRDDRPLTCVACVACNGAARNADRPGRYLAQHGAIGEKIRRYNDGSAA